MTLTFLGTRGNIDVSTRRHRRHTSTLVSHRRTRIMIDCGADWLGHIDRVAPDAVVLTHAHPDHIDGLRHGAPCPVHAPTAVVRAVGGWPLEELHSLEPGVPTDIGAVRLEAVSVEHSVNAPAVAYRVTAGAVTIFYVPDVFRIPDPDEALRGITLYVGDGATVNRPIVRLDRRTGQPVGHASIATQLEWCARAGVARAVFTHCGRAIVAGPADIEAQVSALGRMRHVDTRVAWDGLRMTIR
jgi:phosphoribosyl 1,2-cyclic phosphodiesterase